MSGHSQSKNPARPNIIIVYTDDQGYGDVSALNPAAKFRTPNMDRIAQEGIIFTDGHSSDGVCTPSRYSLLTGRYSWRTSLKKGVLEADGPCLIEDGRMTIASLLRNKGYYTAMIGKWHLQMDFAGTKGKDRDWSAPFTGGPLDHGFDYFFGIPASMNYGILTYLENDKVLDPPVLWTKKKAVSDPRSFRDQVRPNDYRMTPPYQQEPGAGSGWIEVSPSFNDELVLETFAAKAVDFINKAAKEAKNGKPFFLYLPLTSPHLPHCTHPDFTGRSECGNYGDFMEETDYRVGQVLDALASNGIADNTLLIFSSDNGAETNYEYHRETYGHYSSLHFKGGKRDIYEGGHRVPFLMRWPAVIRAGSKVDLPVCQTDYLATIAEIVGASLPENAGEDSYSLLPAMKGEKYDDTLRGPVIHHSASGHFAIRDGKWKLNMFRGSGGSMQPSFIAPQSGEPPYELYDLETDPGETNNLFAQHPEVVHRLETEITAIINNGRSTPGEPQSYVQENWPQLTWMEQQALRPASLFCDHMVLQREQVVPVWGQASPGEQVTVTFAGQIKTTRADQAGKWMIKLDPLSATKKGREMRISGKSEVVISDILVGEVWICSGQSNMQYGVNAVPEIKGLIPFMKNIRSFEVKRTVSLGEAEDVSGQWTTSFPSSAVAFGFAYFLEHVADIPIGIILSAWGSSSLEAWMPQDMTEKLPHFKTIMQEFDADTTTQNRIRQILAAPDGWSRQEDIFLRRQPNILYNAMMKPLAPYACRGLVWYQGERNTRYLSGMPEVNEDNWFHRVAGMKEYGGMLSEWILRYRQEWKNEDMHFMVVMLPGYGKGTAEQPDIDPEDPTAQSWAWIRESQLKVLDLAGTSVVNTIDLGDEKDVHPKDKLPIGQRLALMAAKNTLGQPLPAEGPMMEKVVISGDELIVHFKHAEGLKTTNNQSPSGFWLADDSGRWKPANATINGETVVLSSPEISQPLYVRYAFAGKPKVNLVNGVELPAYPFRTDQFEK